MTFTTTALINGGVLVEGTDSAGYEGRTILHSDSWALVQHLRAHEVAQADFDAAVEAFFTPLTEAADKAHALLKGPGTDWSTVTLGEQVEGHEAEVVQLDGDGILLRILAEGNQNLLRWVNGELVAIQV